MNQNGGRSAVCKECDDKHAILNKFNLCGECTQYADKRGLISKQKRFKRYEAMILSYNDKVPRKE